VEVATNVTVPVTIIVFVLVAVLLDGLEGLELLPQPAMKATGTNAMRIKKLMIIFTGTSPLRLFQKTTSSMEFRKLFKARSVP
jgi:hypothetical protein